MKKLIFLLLCTVSIYGQTTTGQEQEFDYGIKNNSTQTITTPPYLTTTGMDGTQGKIPSALIEKTDNKQNSLAVDGTGTKYPTVDAVNTGLVLKALDSNVVHKTGDETKDGSLSVTKQDPNYEELTAIKGITTGNGQGVFGSSDTGNGMYGLSVEGTGVAGYSNEGNGMYGASNTGTGVTGYSNDGNGMYGASNTGTGVTGYSNDGNGATINIGSSNIQPIAKFQKAGVDKVVIQNDGTISATNYNGGATLTGTPTAPTAAPGTTGNQIATLDYVQANAQVRPYKVYTALLSQTGTNAPTATVFENTLGGTIVWSYSITGEYIGTLNEAFLNNKTFLNIKNNLHSTITEYTSSIGMIAIDKIVVGSKINGVSSDGAMLASIEIRVYN